MKTEIWSTWKIYPTKVLLNPWTWKINYVCFGQKWIFSPHKCPVWISIIISIIYLLTYLFSMLGWNMEFLIFDYFVPTKPAIWHSVILINRYEAAQLSIIVSLFSISHHIIETPKRIQSYYTILNILINFILYRIYYVSGTFRLFVSLHKSNTYLYQICKIEKDVNNCRHTTDTFFFFWF